MAWERHPPQFQTEAIDSTTERRERRSPDTCRPPDPTTLPNGYYRLDEVSQAATPDRPRPDRERCVGQIPTSREEHEGRHGTLGKDRTKVGHYGDVELGETFSDLCVTRTKDLLASHPGGDDRKRRVGEQGLAPKARGDCPGIEEEPYVILRVVPQPGCELVHEVAEKRDFTGFPASQG